MIVRPYQPGDEEKLHEIYESTDFHQLPFPDLSKQLVTSVLTDETGPVMCAYMRLVPEGTLICGTNWAVHPLVKLRGIKMLHENLRDVVVGMGYSEAIASVPPQLHGYRRHLQRHLNWQESWPTYRILDWRRS